MAVWTLARCILSGDPQSLRPNACSWPMMSMWNSYQSIIIPLFLFHHFPISIFIHHFCLWNESLLEDIIQCKTFFWVHPHHEFVPRVFYTTVTIALFLFVSQVTANALLVRTRECWRMCQRLMDSQFLRVLIPRAVSIPKMHMSTLSKYHQHSHINTHTQHKKWL